jgi:site-specific recombinase XerD
MDIMGDQHFQDWVKSRNIRESTIIVYCRSIKDYCKFIGKNPTELITEAEDEEDQRLRLKDRKIKRYLLDYHQHLRDKDLSYYTVKRHITTVKNFYREYEIQLPRLSIRSPGQTHQMSTDLPGKKDIGLALRNCNKKYQSIILLMASSGMGRAEVKHLKIKDYFTALNRPVNVGEIESILAGNDNDLIGCWKVTRFKTGMPYYTFNSPKANKQ